MIAFTGLTWWHWAALAATLVAIEAFAPGFALLWLGLAAGGVGLILLLVPSLPLAWQLVSFAALAVAGVLGWRYWQERHPPVSDRPSLNQRNVSSLGRRLTLVEPIVNGYGRVKRADGPWAVRGPDLPEGALVEVVGADGIVLQVHPASAQAELTADAPRSDETFPNADGHEQLG